MKTIAQFAIPYTQLLGADGEPTGELPAFTRDPEEVLRMYRAMTLVRTFDAKAVNLQRTGQLGTYAPCLGHEATHVGVGAAMRPEDVLAPVYREYGTQLWRGVTMREILIYWGGDERGSDFAGPRKDFAWCVPIATQTLHAAGAAMAFKIRGEKRCALAYVGDGGTSEGAFYEALNLAGARSLPAVFVIVNNGWAISVPVAAQTARLRPRATMQPGPLDGGTQVRPRRRRMHGENSRRDPYRRLQARVRSPAVTAPLTGHPKDSRLRRGCGRRARGWNRHRCG